MPGKKEAAPDFGVKGLGECKIQSPLARYKQGVSFVDDQRRIIMDLDLERVVKSCHDKADPVSLELAGPRHRVYFDPAKTKAAVVACGGLCPGINSVIRSIVLELHYNYGVRNILGIKFGLEGFIPEYGHDVLEMSPSSVVDIHGRGGCFLGMSRGPQDIEEVVDSLERLNVSIIFTIGGDGTLKASHKIQQEITRRGLKTAVVAIPKTIDNDIAFVSKTFGFDSAVEAATNAIASAHNEAISLPNGIGLVKVMGRYAGFVAAHATLALADVNFCLIPEVPFDLEGPNGLLAHVLDRVVDRGHAVILTAEGAGQHLFQEGELERDASGNVRLHDVGTFLRSKITEYFSEKGIILNLKYIDPSYMVRSVPGNAIDRIFCGFLGQNAVHAGMAGKTDIMVSSWNGAYVHVPLQACTSSSKKVDPRGSLWRSVREVTGQPSLINE